jgi:endo-beta-N-acetylglucosaminidase D
MTNAQATGAALRAPSINPVLTMADLRNWHDLKEAANIARVPLADRVAKLANGVNTLVGFDMGEFQYDPWFTQWSQGARGDEGKRSAANVYNFSYWQYVGASYYFGHQLLTIPPTVWTNAAHKNGVPSLGTVCLNWAENTDRYTEDEVAAFLTPTPSNPDKSKIYLEEAIELLLAIKNYYAFDGYLFNLEYRFDSGYPAEKLRQGMIRILSTLKHNDCQTAWYDFEFSNNGPPANYLNPAQWDFFQAVTYFQPNYWWGPYQGRTNGGIVPAWSWNTLVEKDPANALKNRDSVLPGVYCSIDPKNYGSPPYKGTFFPALELIKSAGNPPDYYTGLCLYYPAWVMYDFRPDNTGHVTDELPDRSFFQNNDQAFWTGTRDMFKWPDPNKPVNPIASYQCIRNYVLERTVFNSVPFVTCFNDGEGDFYNIEGVAASTGSWNNLSDQSILPTFRFSFDGGKAKKTNNTRIYHDNPDFVLTGGSSLSIAPPDVGEQPFYLDLFRTEITLTATNVVQLVMKNYAVAVKPVIQVLYTSDVTLENPKIIPLTNGWVLYEFAVPADLAKEVMVGLNLRVDPQFTAGGHSYVGQLGFLDTSSKLPPPMSKRFPGNATELDWSDIYVPTSHYRVYGELNGTPVLIGVVYNSVYRVQYGEAPNITPADHIFNKDLDHFNSFVVQEVNIAGASAKF